MKIAKALHLFYDDPRVRADYLQWAPILLACEDLHHARREGAKTGGPPSRRGRS